LFKVCIVNKDKQARWENIDGDREIIVNGNIIAEFTAGDGNIIITQSGVQ
jgi:hypothetical protein